MSNQSVHPAINDFLKNCQYDSTAVCTYDIMAGGLVWTDEVPNPSDRGLNLRVSVYLRSVIAYRASLSLNQPRLELENDWNELKKLLPNWPGFKEERIYGEAQRILKIHKYKETKPVDQALDDLDSSCEKDR